MGSNKSKQTKQTKPYLPRQPPKPVEIRPARVPSPPAEPEPKPRRRHTQRLPQVLPRYLPRRDRLYNPQSVRPIELSWLQKNGENDDYSRINYHYHNLHQPHYHGHYHQHHHQHNLNDHEHDTPIPLAIKRWPIASDKFARSRFRLHPEFRSKSFIDEYVYQKKAAV